MRNTQLFHIKITRKKTEKAAKSFASFEKCNTFAPAKTEYRSASVPRNPDI